MLGAARRVIGEHRDPGQNAPEILNQPGASPQIQLLGYLGRAPGAGTGQRDPYPVPRRQHAQQLAT